MAGYSPKDCLIAPWNLHNENHTPTEDDRITLNTLSTSGGEVETFIVTGDLNEDEKAHIIFGCWLKLYYISDSESAESQYISALSTLTLNLLSSCMAESLIRSLIDTRYALMISQVDYETYKTEHIDAHIDVPQITTMYTSFVSMKTKEKFGCAAVMAGMMFTLMGKHVHPQTPDTYFKVKYSAFAARQGVTSEVLKMNMWNVPDRGNCESYYKVISGLHNFRKTVFFGLRAAVKGPHDMRGAMCTAYQYLASTEMTHIEMILTYVVGQFPELVSLHSLYREHQSLGDAMTFLKNKPAADRPYAKIIYPQEETKVLAAKNFFFLTAAAKIVASYYNPSYKNYKGGNDHEHLESIITGYIKTRTEDGRFSIVGSGQDKKSN